LHLATIEKKEFEKARREWERHVEGKRGGFQDRREIQGTIASRPRDWEKGRRAKAQTGGKEGLGRIHVGEKGFTERKS